MERHFEQEYEQIRQHLLKMGGLVETAVSESIRALCDRDEERAAQVVRNDRAVDEAEIQLDEECQRLLALFQPTAGDLRFLVAVMKIANDLERVGDLAGNIARSAMELKAARLEMENEIVHLSEAVSCMVRDSLDALVRRDTVLAMTVWENDDSIDDLYRKHEGRLVQLMAEEPAAVSRALPQLLICRNLERIADHATNIAEDVIYYVEGRDIRHSATDYGDVAGEEKEDRG